MNTVFGVVFLGIMLLMAAAIWQLIIKLPEMMEKRTKATATVTDAILNRAGVHIGDLREENEDLRRIVASRDDQINILRSTIMQFRTHGHPHALPEGKTDSAQDVVNDAEILSEEDEKYTAQVVSLMDQQEKDARQWRTLKQWVKERHGSEHQDSTLTDGDLATFALNLMAEPVEADWDDSTTHSGDPPA